MKFFLAALSLAGGVSLTRAAPAKICKDQNPCLDFSVTLLLPGDADYDACPTCTYKVCMTIDQNDECIKEFADEFSHTCEKSATSCIDTKGFSNAIEVKGDEVDTSLNHGYTQCQLVPPNGVAEFLLKDGKHDSTDTCNTVDTGSTYYFAPRGVENGPSGVMVSCADSPYPPKNDCNLNTQACSCSSSGDECVWTIQVPAQGQSSGCGGDPHFKRWGQERSSFHGECDLVLVHSQNFHHKAGFDLHARTVGDIT